VLILQDVPPLSEVKQGCGAENKLFSRKMHLYLKNGMRYIQSYY